MTNKATILIVDDEPINRTLLEDTLVPQGYRTVSAQDGVEALAKVAQEKPDLILLDVMMPKIDGFEVCRRLKNDEKTRWIPIIIITSLADHSARVKGIEAGADDFVSKPFDDEELSVRVRSLLRVKRLNDQVIHSYTHINRMSGHTSALLENFHPDRFELEPALLALLDQLLKTDANEPEKPESLWISLDATENARNGRLYRRRGEGAGQIDSVPINLVFDFLPGLGKREGDILISNWQEVAGGLAEYQRYFPPCLQELIGPIHNLACYDSKPILIVAFNYGKEVTDYEAAVFKNLMTHTHFMKIIAGQLREVEEAFQYTIGALARAAEANDEDTGNHILRVNRYSELLARTMRLPDDFSNTIGNMAQMHDVGKIHIHPDILRKPGLFTPEEFEIVKQHSVYGSKILGDSPHLAMAREIALHHHEKWDGSGYPQGLKGEAISLAGRIVTLADIYDALRSKRNYKPAFSHADACRVILEGDGRVEPGHFDPDVLAAFPGVSPRFEEIYESLKNG